MKIENLDFNKVSFSDCKIEKFEIDFLLKELTISLDTIYYKTDNVFKEFKNVFVKVFSWRKIIITVYDPKDKTWKTLNENNYDIFREICEIKYDGANLVLSGFGKNTNEWIQYTIDTPKAILNYN